MIPSLFDDLGQADLVPSQVVVLVEEFGGQLFVNQRAAGKEPESDQSTLIHAT